MNFLFVLLIFCMHSLCATDWQRVYLATFPRSGNHWVRYLIEDATHIATSSVYQDADDVPHLADSFSWGGFCAQNGYKGNCRYPTDIVIIKTHFPHILSQFDHNERYKVIRIVRHPVDSIYSHYSHMHIDAPIFPEILCHLVNEWKSFQEYWNNQPDVFTFRYEDLLYAPHTVLTKIIATAGYEASVVDIQRAIALNPPKGFFLKHRAKFTAKDLEYIQNELADLIAYFGYRSVS